MTANMKKGSSVIVEVSDEVYEWFHKLHLPYTYPPKLPQVGKTYLDVSDFDRDLKNVYIGRVKQKTLYPSQGGIEYLRNVHYAKVVLYRANPEATVQVAKVTPKNVDCSFTIVSIL